MKKKNSEKSNKIFKLKSIKLKLITLFVTLVLFVMIISGLFIHSSIRANEENRTREELSSFAEMIPELGLEESKAFFRPGMPVLILDERGYTVGTNEAINSAVVIGAMNGNSTFLPWQEIQNEQGRSIWMQYARPIIIGEENYIIYINLEASAIVENLNQISRTVLTAILISIALAIILGYLYAITFTKPLIELTNAAKKMGKGKLKTEAKIYSEDEIGQLTESFNNMAKSLNKLDTMRKEFVANVSHEIRTPLTVIKTYAETLKDELTESEIAQSFLNTIDLEVDRITLLATDLLELSHFDTKQMSMTFEYRDLGQILLNSIKQVNVLAVQKNQKIVSDISNILESKEEMIAYVDSVRINQVFVNIISNAVKYSDENITITISTKITKNHFYITITDEGIGIPEEDLNHIFERFYRVDKARNRESGGSGLGLSIVKEILDAHEASVNVKSKKGKGTTFELIFKKETIS